MASKRIYKGRRIKIDLDNQKYIRESDKNWMPLYTINQIILSQVPMNQGGGGRFLTTNHKYNAFCVYIVTERNKILAYQGNRKKVINEANKIAQYTNKSVRDLIPRNTDGSIKDDDYNSYGCLSISLILILFIIIFFFIISIVKFLF